MSILVFDIETIPDIKAGQKLYGLEDLSPEDTAKAMFALRKQKVGHTFLPHHLQQIVAISLVMQQDDHVKVWSLGDETADEAELIERFFTGIEKHTPTLVSWNGSGFDLPVLHYRALLHQIEAPKYWEAGDNLQPFRFNNYLNRFHARHLDLMDTLAGYQNKAFAPLDEIASLLGFPGKMGMSGARVWDEYLAGNLSAIRDYCETDVLNTFCVYLRFERMRGKLTTTQYNTHIENLQIMLESEKKPHLSEFLETMTRNPSNN